jgi:hypothetical protein
MPVIIGRDPHKRSATIEVVDERAQILAVGRFGTDKVGYGEMLAAGREYPDRITRSRAATASASTSRTGWSTTARPSSMCRRSSPHGSGCSPPVTLPRATRPSPSRQESFPRTARRPIVAEHRESEEVGALTGRPGVR